MEEIIINHLVKKENEGKYYTLEFDVPEGAERLSVSYSCLKRGKNIVDLGLLDAGGRFLGWSGSARRTVYVGGNQSTIGYLKTPVTPGRWSILVGAYKIAAQGVEVEYKITFEKAKNRLYFGDLHVHSTASDGKYDKYALAKLAKKRGLDFIAVADHNNFAENFSLPEVPGLTFIPAVEWTHYRGHVNMYGAVNPFDNSFIANSDEEAERVAARAKELGALICANHPKCNLCPYLFGENLFDMAEVWNGPMRPVNIRAVDWWTGLLRKGRRIPIAGGSDFHKKRLLIRMGNPVTAVAADSPRAEDILSAVAAGHAFVTSSTKGPRLALKYKDAGMGDTAKYEPGRMIEISASLLRGAALVLVDQDGEKKLTGYISGEIKLSAPIAGAEFAYVKAVGRLFKGKYVKAVTNPVYFEAQG